MNCGDKYVGNTNNASGLTNEQSSFFRPANLFKYLISRGPLLIGWDDDKFKQLVEKNKNASSGSEGKGNFGEDRRKIEELRSELSSLFIDAIVMNLSEMIQKDEQNTPSNIDPVREYRKYGSRSQDEIMREEVPLYDLISQSLKYHRDSFLVGPMYADIQRFRRTREYHTDQSYNSRNSSGNLNWSHFTFDTGKKEEAVAGLYLQGLADWFIPSKTMVDLVRPTVIWTVSPPSPRSSLWNHTGPLYTPLVQAVTNLIPLSQSMIDQIFKDSVLNLLKSPEWRHWVKGTTGGYVSKLQRDVRDD